MTVIPQVPTIEHHRVALGIGRPRPRLSWKTTAPDAWRQAGYEIAVERDGGTSDSWRVDSNESVLVAWLADPLKSRERAAVRVRVWGEDGDVSGWSDAGYVEAGLLEPDDWSAQVVGPAWPEDRESDRQPPLVRRTFDLDGPVARARLYVTAHGLYEAEINGLRVGNDVLSPGWTVYGSRLRYYTYDVTHLLVAGENAVGAWLADGWYRGRFGFHGGRRNLYGEDIGLIAQLEVSMVDGRLVTIATDARWEAAVGPISFSELYNGETYDARREIPRWSTPGVVGGTWTPVAVGPIDTGTLVAPDGPPVRCTEELLPVEVLSTPSGRPVLDFGQNFAGRLRIRVDGPAGTTVVLRHAEVMQDGEIYTRPLREAAATDTYVLAGGPAVWEPRFTMHGFRYAEVSGWPGEIHPGDVVGLVCHTDMERTGWFETSDALVNRLHENVRWSMRSNFVDIPTDCPQRDERLGWTGDIQVFAPTASFLYDCSGLLISWLQDVAVEQLPDGTVPWYVPVIPGDDPWTPIRPGAVWGDTAVLTPWDLYTRFGDTNILADQYKSARGWVDLVDRLAGPSHLWNTGFQLGDWLDPAAPPDDPAAASTDKYLVATAYFARSAHRLAETARVLGREGDAQRYAALAAAVRAAFATEYVLDGGRLKSDAQTAYALAIAFDLYPDEASTRLGGKRLAELVREGRDRIATGFAGTPLVTDTLTMTGEIERAYALLLNRACPSWLYTVVSGGTTIWERWDSQLPDGTVNPGGMTSFNHYALGAVADWLHRSVAGIAPAAPGYREILFEPRPGGGLTFAGAEHETPYGRAAIRWEVTDGTCTVQVRVPTGTTAHVVLPDGTTSHVGPGTHVLVSDGIERPIAPALDGRS